MVGEPDPAPPDHLGEMHRGGEWCMPNFILNKVIAGKRQSLACADNVAALYTHTHRSTD